MGIDRTGRGDAVTGTLQNSIRALCAKLDATDTFVRYREDAAREGDEEAAALFGSLEDREREAAGQILESLRGGAGETVQGGRRLHVEESTRSPAGPPRY